MAASEFVIGKHYTRPCVKAMWDRKIAWWPVLGPLHEDSEFINYPYQHWHVDYRFLSKKNQSFDAFALPIMHYLVIEPDHGKPVSELESDRAKWGEAAFSRLALGDTRWFAWRSRKCQASWPDHPSRQTKWIGDMENAYAGSSALRPDGSLVCPHRGAPLDGLRQSDGCVTCPLHGLKWNATTGALKRTALKESRAGGR